MKEILSTCGQTHAEDSTTVHWLMSAHAWRQGGELRGQRKVPYQLAIWQMCFICRDNFAQLLANKLLGRVTLLKHGGLSDLRRNVSQTHVQI